MNRHGHDGPDQLRALFDDDATIDAIGRGVTPDDELGQLLASLRDEARAPHAPFDPATILGTQQTDHAPEQQVDELSARRSAREGTRRRGKKPMSAPTAGVIGAAAASIVMAIGGLAFLGPANSAQDAAVVELASTLEEIDTKAGEGDMDATRSLLAEARNLVAELDRREPRIIREEKSTPETAPTSTSTSEASSPSPQPEPEPVAPVTVTETVTVTRTVAPTPAQQPSTAASTSTRRTQSSAPASPPAVVPNPEASNQQASEPLDAAHEPVPLSP